MVLLDLGSGFVTPDWFPLALVGVLLAVLAAIFFNMRRHLRRINVADDPADLPEG